MAVNLDALIKKSSGESQAIRQTAGVPATPIVAKPQKQGFLGKVKSLAERVGKAFPQSGTKFFTGTPFQKAIDILEIPQYFLAGGLRETEKAKIEKGERPNVEYRLLPKEFSLGKFLKGGLEGIKSRASFVSGPKSVLAQREKISPAGTGEKLGAFGAELAAPSLPLAPLLKTGKKVMGAIPGVGKLATKITKFAKETPDIYKPIETFAPYFRKPEFGKLLKESETATQVRLSGLYKTVKETSEGLNPEARKIVGELIEAGPEARKGQGVLGQIASSISDMADEVGQEATKLGLLPEETFVKFKGKYMTHIWDDIIKGKKDFLKVSDIPQYSGRFFQKRKGKTGYIQEFAAPVFKGLGTEVKDIEAVKFFKNVAEKFGIKASDDVDELVKIAEKGYEFAGDVPPWKGGDILKQYAFPKEVVDYIQRTQKVPVRTIYDKALGMWKAGKTIYNPSYHIRNVISNQILSDMSTGKGLLTTAIEYVGSVRNYFGKGNQKFVQAAESIGLIKRKHFGEAFNEFLDSADLVQKGKIQKLGNFMEGVQNVSEETSKLQVFKSWVEKFARQAGEEVDDVLADPKILQKAADKAEEAIFSPYKIGQAEKTLLARWIPFYSFTRQAVPFTLKTALEHPKRITKYFRGKRMVESLSKEKLVPEEKRAAWQKNAVQLPWTFKGKPVIFDPTYIYPFGNFFEESDITKGQLPFGLNVTPVLSEPIEQIFNWDLFFGSKIAKSQIPSRALGQRLEHAAYTFAPSVYRTGKGKLYPALTGQPDYAGRERSKAMAILDAFGFKSSVLYPEDEAKFRRMDKNAVLRAIDAEKRSIMKDQRIPVEKKRTVIKALNERRNEVLREK